MFNENTIMIIDNDSLTRFNLKTILWQLNVSVFETEHSLDAITFIVTTKPRIILLSLDTAKDNNYQLLDKINELHGNCKLVLYSDQVTKQDLLSCFNVAKFNHVILNPCQQIDRIQNIVDL
ncbi:MAG: response regulator [Firmicutes bacterium]|nr:response regulator [Bacillota bacterium]